MSDDVEMILYLHMLDEVHAVYAGKITDDIVSIDRQTFMDQGRPVYVIVRVPGGDRPIPGWV